MSERHSEQPQTKICTKCGEGKPMTGFYFEKHRNKHRSDCKTCNNAATRRYYATHQQDQQEKSKQRFYANRETRLINNRARWEKNKERYAETARRWNAANREKRMARHREYLKDYKVKNADAIKQKSRERYRQVMATRPELIKAKAIRRRARKANASGSHTAAQLRKLCESQKWKCWYCECSISVSNHHIDHRVPLSRGGSNDISNLVATCPTCNLSKFDRMPHEWCGRLL